MKGLKKYLAVALLMLSFLFVYDPVSIKAVNQTITLKTISDTYLTTILTDLKSRRSNFYTDYDYLIYDNNTTYWSILLIPKVNVSSFIFGKPDTDTTLYQDIDDVQLMRYCSVANPCYTYRYTQSTRAYYEVVTYTDNSLNIDIDSSTSWGLYYTSIRAKTYVGYFDQYCDITCYEFTTFDMASSYNLKNIPLSVVQALGESSPTDEGVKREMIVQFEILGQKLTLDLSGIVEALDVLNDMFVEFIGGDSLHNWLVGFLGQDWIQPYINNPDATWFQVLPAWFNHQFDQWKQDIAGDLKNIADFFIGIVDFCLYSLTRLTEFLVIGGNAITMGAITSILALPAALQNFFTYFPDPIDDVFAGVFAIFTGSTAIRIVWYIATLGAKT